MRNSLLMIVTTLTLLIINLAPVMAQDNPCEISQQVVLEIRQLLTAPDNVPFTDIFSGEVLACAAIEIINDDPVDDEFHERVITGAVVLLGQSGDPRAIPALIDAIDLRPAQALYNLGNFSTVDSLNALVANIRNEDDEARESAAEGLRQLKVPDDPEDGWVDALNNALTEVGDWMTQEPVPDFQLYFIDAYANLQHLHDAATQTVVMN